MTRRPALSLDAAQRPWLSMEEPDKEAIRTWMRAAGIDPDETLGITLGEGHVIAEHPDEPLVDYELMELRRVTRTYPVRTLPPVWPTVEVDQ